MTQTNPNIASACDELLFAANIVLAAKSKLERKLPADIAALLEAAAETCRLVADDLAAGRI